MDYSITCGACGVDIPWARLPQDQQRLIAKHDRKCKGRKNA